jgi:hypothetical protein
VSAPKPESCGASGPAFSFFKGDALSELAANGTKGNIDKSTVKKIKRAFPADMDRMKEIYIKHIDFVQRFHGAAGRRVRAYATYRVICSFNMAR